MPLRGVGAVRLGPSAVAVEHDADVAGQALVFEASGESALVCAVQQVTQPHGDTPSSSGQNSTVLRAALRPRRLRDRAHKLRASNVRWRRLLISHELRTAA